MKKCCNDKLENFLDMTKINELINRKQPEPVKEKKNHTVMWVLIIIGIIVAVAGVAYALYKHFCPDYLEDYEDDFDDDFDDEFFEDEDKDSDESDEDEDEEDDDSEDEDSEQ